MCECVCVSLSVCVCESECVRACLCECLCVCLCVFIQCLRVCFVDAFAVVAEFGTSFDDYNFYRSH